MSTVPQRLLLVLFCAVGYSSLICCHEFTHCVAARMTGLHPTIFRFGHGEPSLLLGRWGSTQIRLCPFILGGSVRIEEFQIAPGVASTPILPADCMRSILVRLAGPLCSMLMALILFAAAIRGRVSDRLQTLLTTLPEYSLELCATIGKMLLFCNQSALKEDKFYYWRMQDIPFRATDSICFVLVALGGTAYTEAIFNVLPFPVLDGGKAAIDCWELVRGTTLDADTEIIASILSFLALAIAVLASVYRGVRWPFPRFDHEQADRPNNLLP